MQLSSYSSSSISIHNSHILIQNTGRNIINSLNELWTKLQAFILNVPFGKQIIRNLSKNLSYFCNFPIICISKIIVKIKIGNSALNNVWLHDYVTSNVFKKFFTPMIRSISELLHSKKNQEQKFDFRLWGKLCSVTSPNCTFFRF